MSGARTMSDRRSKRAVARSAEAARHARVLDQWCEVSGMTLAALIAEIERSQPGKHPADMMGIGPEVGLFVEGFPAWNTLAGKGKILALRAVQHLCCERPWRRTDPPGFVRLPDLFGEAR